MAEPRTDLPSAEPASDIKSLITKGKEQGFLTYAETLTSMRLFTQEVYPRLQELTASCDSESLQALRACQPDKEFADLGAFGVEFVR